MMKKVVCLSFLSFILSIHLNGQILQLKDLKDKILASLKTESFDTFKQLLLDTNDYKEYVNNSVGNDSIRNVVLLQFKNFILSDTSKSFYKQVFTKLVDRGRHFQIDWNKIHDSKIVIQDSATAPVNLFSIGNISFAYKDSNYAIFYIMIVRLFSGFKILNIYDIGNYNSIIRDIFIDDAKERNKKTKTND
jgi:hypothetical protein